jgi:hypothetical protein
MEETNLSNNELIDTPKISKTMSKGLGSIISTSSGNSSNESSRRNSLSDKEIEKMTMTTYPHILSGEKKGPNKPKHQEGSRHKKSSSGKIRFRPEKYTGENSVEEVLEEFEAEKERQKRVPRVRLVNDCSETIPSYWTKETMAQRCNSLDCGRLFKVDEDVGEDEVRKTIPKVHNRIYMEDKNEFNSHKKEALSSCKSYGDPKMRKSQTFFNESCEEVILEDLAVETRENENNRKKRWLTPRHKKSGNFTRTLKVDEIEKAVEKKILEDEQLEDKSPVREVIEEEKPEEKNYTEGSHKLPGTFGS